jgi:hypothetical protein
MPIAIVTPGVATSSDLFQLHPAAGAAQYAIAESAEERRYAEAVGNFCESSAERWRPRFARVWIE